MLFMYLQVVGVSWLNDQALAVVSEQGPRSHVHLYDASGAPLSATAGPPFKPWAYQHGLSPCFT